MPLQGRRDEVVAWLTEHLAATPSHPLGEGYQAKVSVYATPFGDVVVKSPHQTLFWERFGLRTIRHEFAHYSTLQGIPGIPRVYGLINGRHLAIEYIPGASFRARQYELKDRHEFFDRLLATVQGIHARGVAHADLKRKDNILVGPDEQPWLIDFGVACQMRPDAGMLSRVRFRWFRQLDLNAWIKLKYGRGAVGLSAADAPLYQPLLLERLARWLRVPWQVISLRRRRQRWRQQKSQRRTQHRK